MTRSLSRFFLDATFRNDLHSRDPRDVRRCTFVESYAGYTPGLLKYDIKTGRVVEQVDFVLGSADIHDVTVNKGQLYGATPASIRAGQSMFPSISTIPAAQQPDRLPDLRDRSDLTMHIDGQY